MDFEFIIIGMALYFLMKLFAYTAFAKFLNIYFQQKNNVWKIGFIRTIIGVVLGAIHNSVLLAILQDDGRLPFAHHPFIFISLLAVLRVFEWWLIIRLFYKSNEQTTKKKIIAISAGIVCSFIIDIPVFLGLISVVSSIC